MKPGRHRGGRNFKGSTIVDGRQYAVNVQGTVITFECARKAHRYSVDFSKRAVARRLSEAGCKLMARWWSRERGGCIGSCAKCRALARKETS